MDEEYKIKGWVARDKNVDGFWGNGLILHHSKPTREGNEWSSKTIAMHLPNKLFPTFHLMTNQSKLNLQSRSYDTRRI